MRFWLPTAVIYWAVASYALWWHLPPWEDGSGRTPNIYWSCTAQPLPGPGEYERSFAIRWRFYREYLMVGVGLTVAGFLAARRAAHPRSALGWGMAAVWLGMGVSMIGNWAGLWCGPARPFGDFDSLGEFTWTTAIYGLLTAIWVIARDLYRACAGPRNTAFTNSTLRPSK